MSPTVDATLGRFLSDARAALGLSLQEVAAGAGCSSAYVHKLEQDRVRTPSPRVLAGLAQTLGVDYGVVMRTAGYESPTDASETTAPAAPAAPAVARFSNAHVVGLLETLLREVAELKELVGERSGP